MLDTIDIDRILHENFGLESLRPKQKEVIDLVLSGKHTLALLPTGYGKSLCYQVPSMALSGITLVVSPLIALMQDQMSGLTKRGIASATVLNSSIASDEYERRLQGIAQGRLKLVYVAPERFESPRFRSLVESLNVSLLVIDEAHCISQWGHDFRPNYRTLKDHIALMPEATILAVTATATPRVRQDIVNSLNLPDMTVVQTSFDRPNLHFNVFSCANDFDKDQRLLRALGKDPGPTIIYASSRKQTEELAHRLANSGISAGCYHAGLQPQIRQKAQRNFEEEIIPVIVSTVAFGMGVDKANVRRVIHYNMPGSLESYYQEAGRAGRDGEQAHCSLLFQARDIHIQRWFLQRNFPSAKQVGDVLSFLQRAAAKSSAPPRPAEITASISKLEDSALNSALDLLKMLGLVRPSADGFCVTPQGAEVNAAIDMTSLNQRQRREEDRLDKIVRYAYSTTCRRRVILDYFGQELDGLCAGCDICHKIEDFSDADLRSSPSLPKLPGGSKRHKQAMVGTSGAGHRTSAAHGPATRSDANELAATILELTAELKGKFGRTTIAQVLGGSKASKLQAQNLNKLNAYGSFAHMSNTDILATIDTLVAEGKLRVVPGPYPKLVATSL
jgi:ATP-dependent DNA helicase RecQ